jgi:hypothetical protein
VRSVQLLRLLVSCCDCRVIKRHASRTTATASSSSSSSGGSIWCFSSLVCSAAAVMADGALPHSPPTSTRAIQLCVTGGAGVDLLLLLMLLLLLVMDRVWGRHAATRLWSLLLL